MVSRIIWGLVIAGAGTALVLYTEAIMSFAGRMDWADSVFGIFGGSRLGYKLVGILAIIVGFLYATGLLGPAMIWFFGGFFQGAGPR
jgi:hypothetical protein